MNDWIRNFFKRNKEVDLLQAEIEELINKAEDVFDLNIIWGKMIIFAKMEKSDVDVASSLRDTVFVKEAEINKKQVEAFNKQVEASR